MKSIFYFYLLILLLICSLILIKVNRSGYKYIEAEKYLNSSVQEFLNNYKVDRNSFKLPKINNLSELMGNIFYINLDHRKDRKKILLSNLEKYGFPNSKVSRFPAIKEKEGALGCLKSHYFLTRDYTRYQNNNNYLTVLEDDFSFNRNLDDINSSIINFINKIPEWDVLLLCCNTNSLKAKKVVDNIYRVKSCQVAAGYIINPNYVKKYSDFLSIAISTMEKYDCFIKGMIIDLFWQHLQKVDKWYTILPLIGIQVPSYSDIEHTFKDYSKFFL